MLSLGASGQRALVHFKATASAQKIAVCYTSLERIRS